MPGTPSAKPNATQLRQRVTLNCRQLQAGISAAWERIQRLPRWLRLVGAALAILLVGISVASWAFSTSARLNITCQHSFRSAEVSVWIDSKLIYAGNVNGSANRRFRWFGNTRTEGLFKTVNVSAGRHTVQVRLNAEAEGYDQIRTVSAVFSENQDNSLSISAGRRGLSVVPQGSANVQSETVLPDSFVKYAGSVVLTILGSGLSAVIGFLVQEFMRSQKARLMPPNSPVQ